MDEFDQRAIQQAEEFPESPWGPRVPQGELRTPQVEPGEATGAQPAGMRSQAPGEPRRQAELRAYQPTLQDKARQALIDLGVPPEQAQRAASIIPFTPPGIAYEGGRMIGQGIQEGSPGQVAGGVATTAIAAAPGPVQRGAAAAIKGGGQALYEIGRTAGKAVTSAPKTLAGIGLAAGLTTPTEGETPEAGAPAPTAERARDTEMLRELLLQRRSLDKQRATAVEERDAQLKGSGGRKAGRGPVYDAKEKEVSRLTDEMGALDGTIADIRNRLSPEYQMKIEEQRKAVAQAEKEKRAATPTRQLYSDYMPYLYPVGAGIALVGGALLKGRALANYNREIADLSQRWSQAVQRGQTARPNTNAARAAGIEARGIQREYDALRARHERFFDPGTRDAITFGAASGVTVAFSPEEIDFARAVAGSPLWQSLKENLIDDWPTTLKRAGVAAGLGAATAHVGAEAVKPFISRPLPPGYGPATDALPPPPTPRGPRGPGSPGQLPSEGRRALPAPSAGPEATPRLPSGPRPRSGGSTSTSASPEPSIVPGTDALGRTYHRNVGTGRFSSKPKTPEEEGREALELYKRASKKTD
jgi:hypothetical protein